MTETFGKSILEILDDHDIPYQPQGQYFICYCPKHDDTTTPNMVIYPDTNSFFCFACKFGSKPEDLLCELDGISKKDAIELIYGEEYIIRKLEEEVSFKIQRYPLRLLLSSFIQKRLKERPVNNLITHLKWLDSMELSSKNLKEVMDIIERWD